MLYPLSYGGGQSKMVRRMGGKTPTLDNLERVTEPREEKPSQDGNQKAWLNAGLGAAFGVAAGTAVFAITDDVFWIAIGPAFGVAAAVVFASAKR